MSEALVLGGDIVPAGQDEVEARIARGIDPGWSDLIIEIAEESTAIVEAARAKLAGALKPGETTAELIDRLYRGKSKKSRDRGLEMLSADQIVLNHVDRGDLSTDQMVEAWQAKSNELRAAVLADSFYSIDQVASMFGVDREEVVAMIDKARFVVVKDYGDMIFPAFQFSSPEAHNLVSRHGASRLKYQKENPRYVYIDGPLKAYPSWDRTSWWFGYYNSDFMEDEPVGERPVDKVRDPSRIREYADFLKISID